ncbi:dTDP-4-amino-4,6-dideoxygalactose transaminase [Christiangramia portivictoriae]|uniref:dTDP-4-amino-4,6-dideoxygalactose transaminase n=1 Tax=Christiangramia portivictoriae TaxID=326069 RepID=UPI0004271896|nr:dTDP-4-amino-4,6-dideoxygalactose transaminase [Christiangramia portivictoriae]
MINIPFNKPYLTGNEIKYIEEAVKSGKISGNGDFTNKCQNFFQKRYDFGKCFLTSSCTDALEMAAILLNIQPGDEVIIPSYTFVSTANAFVLRGAKIVFVDSRADHPGMDEKSIEALITSKTKVIVPVHYAGIACDMDIIMELAKRYNLAVVEDAAHAIDSFYTGKDGVERALGSIGDMAAFSFHETKNIISGEGGMLVVNNNRYQERAEIIWEKGTNRSAFYRGEVDKYNWVDIGSSFLPSEVTAAFLWAQLENLERIQSKRLQLWKKYNEALNSVDIRHTLNLPVIPKYATNNAHIFYIVTLNTQHRDEIIQRLKSKGILAVFHYVSLHESPFYRSKVKDENQNLSNSARYTECLLRLPLFFELQPEIINQISKTIDEAAEIF